MPIRPAFIGYVSNCQTATDITSNGGSVINNPDGTLSVFIVGADGRLVPRTLNKVCCEALAIPNAYFDINTQKCRWTTNTGKCTLDSVFKLVLNPKGNDGSIFYVDGDEDCQLTIDFDYLFKFDCEKLTKLITTTTTPRPFVPTTTTVVLGPVIGTTPTLGATPILNPTPVIGAPIIGTTPTISTTPLGTLGGAPVVEPIAEPIAPSKPRVSETFVSDENLQQQTAICEQLLSELNNLQLQLETTPYSIECASAPNTPYYRTPTVTDSFNNTAFGVSTNTSTDNTRTTVYGCADGTIASTPEGCKGQRYIKRVVRNTLSFPEPTNDINNKIYCLTETAGLTKWASILGTINYQEFLNGNPSSYTCTDVQTLVDANNIILNNNLQSNTKQEVYINECDIPFGSRNELLNRIDELTQNYNACIGITLRETNVSGSGGLVDAGGLDGGFGGGTGGGGLPGGGTPTFGDVGVIGGVVVAGNGSGTNTGNIGNIGVSTTPDIGTVVVVNPTRPPVILPSISGMCTSPTQALENLDVSFTIDVVETTPTGDTVTTVYEEALFSRIGSGNLYNYLISNSGSTGLYICGDPISSDPANLTSCTPLNFLGNTNNNVYNCDQLRTLLQTELFAESGLPNTTTGYNTFNTNLGNNPFISQWLHFSRVITDTSVLAAIKNKKIKITLKINDACVDFCVLLDSIELNKVCSLVEKNELLISQSPGFTLDRIRDNKKSWINNTSIVHRDFDITRSDNTKPIRFTDYYPNDERLVINSKEIDLDISLASAIETDVWCYMSDNPCLLTGTSIPCGCTVPEPKCCGDEQLDYSELLTQPLSAITVVEDFQYYLTSELIDVKDRKTLSAYPTLRGLYDRYVNSTAYCETISSAFGYETMEQFSRLVGDYWVDIVEQVVPATTIWGSTKIYSNTIFDNQKFKYKSYTLLLGGNLYSGYTVPSPTTATTVGVSAVTTTIGSLNASNTHNYNVVSIAQMNSGSEFLGTVSVVGNTLTLSNTNINYQTISTP